VVVERAMIVRDEGNAPFIKGGAGGRLDDVHSVVPNLVLCGGTWSFGDSYGGNSDVAGYAPDRRY